MDRPEEAPGLEARVSDLEERHKMLLLAFDQLLEAVGSEVLRDVLSALQERDKNRNRSSARTREMTDQDAERVLSGDLKEMNHKQAAAAIGLTYAQVYSCRLAYTFKHVHKRLKETGWKSQWENLRR